jgi:hypothetical protein
MQGGASSERNLGGGGASSERNLGSGGATSGQEGGSMRSSQPSTSGQGSSSDRLQSDQPQAQDRGGATRDETRPQRGDTPRNGAQSQQQRGTSGQSSERGTTGQGSAGSGASTGVNLSSQQRTQIRQVVLRNHSIPHVNNVDVSINVGVVLPRTVELIDVPEDVVTIYPRFRRHKIVIIHDQVVIVEPSTFKIVAVLPA